MEHEERKGDTTQSSLFSYSSTERKWSISDLSYLTDWGWGMGVGERGADVFVELFSSDLNFIEYLFQKAT